LTSSYIYIVIDQHVLKIGIILLRSWITWRLKAVAGSVFKITLKPVVSINLVN